MTEQSKQRRNALLSRLRSTAAVIPSAAWLVAGLMAYEMVTPSSLSIHGAVGEALGAMDASEHSTKASDMAAYEQTLGDAVATVERVTGAYDSLYQAFQSTVSAGLNMEGAVLNKQMSTLSGTQKLEVFGANVASLGCMIGQLAQDAELSKACDAERQMRYNLMQDFAGLGEHRTTIGPELLKRLPTPEELVREDLERLKAAQASLSAR